MRGQIASFAENKNVTNFANGNLPQLIQSIHNAIPGAEKQAENFAYKFKGKTAEETARNIFNFLKNQINYKADPPSRQDIKLPSRLVFDGSGDCKSYSLFTVAVLNNLGYQAGLRYAGYSLANKPTHVYPFLLLPNGQKIFIDAVWGHFNSEKPFTYKKDYLMQINTLSGIGAPADQGRGGQGETRGGSSTTSAKLPANIARVKNVKKKSKTEYQLFLTQDILKTAFVFILTKTPEILKINKRFNPRVILVSSPNQAIPKAAVVVPVANMLPKDLEENTFLGLSFQNLSKIDYRQAVQRFLQNITANRLDRLNEIKTLEKEGKKIGNFIFANHLTTFSPSGASQVLGVNYPKLAAAVQAFQKRVKDAYLQMLQKKATGEAARLANLSASNFRSEATKKNKNAKGRPNYEYLYAAFLQYLKGNLSYYEFLYFVENGYFTPGISYTTAGYTLANDINKLATLRQNVINLIKNPNSAINSIEAAAKNYYQFYNNAAGLIQSTTISQNSNQEAAAKQQLLDVINDRSKSPIDILVELQKSFYTQKTSKFFKFFPLSAASRGAFLGLVRLNAYGLGSLIYLPTLDMKDVKPSGFLNALDVALKGAKIYGSWANGGGDPKELQRIAKNGSKLKPLVIPIGNIKGNLKDAILRLENALPTGVSGIGEVATATTVATALATAAPFVAAIVPVVIALIPEAENNQLLLSLGTQPAATCKPRTKNAEGKTVIELANELACLNTITDLPTAIQAAKDYTALAADIATTKNQYVFEGGEPAAVLAQLAAKAAQIVKKLKDNTGGGGSGSGGDSSGKDTGGGKDNDTPGGGSKTPTLFTNPKAGLLLAGGLGILLISNIKNK